MNRAIFDSYWSSLCNRYPWGKGEEIVAQDYMARLWSKAKEWYGPEENKFRRAVETMVSSKRYGRPAVSEIVDMVLGHKALTPHPEKEVQKVETLSAADQLREWHEKSRARQKAERRERVVKAIDDFTHPEDGA